MRRFDVTCPLCKSRRARRTCPGIGNEICPVCCGTKRLVEIACPPDCPYLASSRAHPAAIVARQQKRDLDFAGALLHSLSENASRLFLVFGTVAKRYRRAAIPPLLDEEVAEAAATLAATLETVQRGILYEHQAQSLTAQRLVSEFRDALAALDRVGGSTLEREAAVALRTLERAAHTARQSLEGGEIAFLGFLDRNLEPGRDGRLVASGDDEPAPAPDAERNEGPRIILP